LEVEIEKGSIQYIGKEMLYRVKHVLLLKIILKYTKPIQLFTGNTKQKLFVVCSGLKMPSWILLNIK